ncbi:MAG: hypothetical protein Tsb0014_35610 [Pleurocapsa sp.]
MTITSKTTQITARVPHDLYEKICDLCRSTSATQTDVVISALVHYFDDGLPFTDLSDDVNGYARKQDVKILFNLVQSYQKGITRDNEAHVKRLDYLDGQIDKLWKAMNDY